MAGTDSTLPFRQFVLKVHSRCDLACDHCYVYEHADQSWRGRPAVMSPETVAKGAQRIADHAEDHGLPAVRVILHGGEPLLAGAPRLDAIARELRRAIEPSCQLDLRIHTNGVRLDAEFCEVLLANRVMVGISLDGDRAANDLHRRYANGRSSYDQVLRAVGLLRQERYREIYAGLLATIDVRSDPGAVYRALAALEPPNLDFLLPHGTWDNPPPGAGMPGATPYAEWLIAVYGEWTSSGRRVPVRIFESIIATSLGGVSGTESLGLAPSDVLVIETDGTLEQADSIKVAYDGAPATGLHISRHPLDAAAVHPAIRARQQGILGLPATCRKCPVVTSCGGGLYAHRYRKESGFDNPSVFCADLLKIIGHVRSRLRSPSRAAAARRPRAHQLAAAHFDLLAAGFGDGETLTELITAQRSVQRALLRMLGEHAKKGTDDRFISAWALLVHLEKEHPAELSHVLAHPYVRTWAEQCLRAVSTAGLPADAGYLAAIVAAVALRAGAPAAIEAPVSQGYVYLPTLGRLRVGSARTVEVITGRTGAQVRSSAGSWDVRLAGPPPTPDWQPVRNLRAGRLAVSLEDSDPYRDCLQWPAAPRLDPAAVARWQEQFLLAWRLIESAYPAYAAGLATGLSTLTPLADGAHDRNISATARHAFGAVGAALPQDADTLALLLIHEFQHVKLGAVLDLFELCDPADQQLFYAPWREDRRPAEALLQGAYAHLGVTDYWRIRRHRADGPEAMAAEKRFARWRVLTAETIDTLAGSGALTPLGTRFVEGMRATVMPWLDEPVADRALEAAGQRATRRR